MSATFVAVAAERAADCMRGYRRVLSDTHPQVGTNVILHSLSARADLNGLLGTVAAPIDIASRRIAVSLPPDNEASNYG